MKCVCGRVFGTSGKPIVYPIRCSCGRTYANSQDKTSVIPLPKIECVHLGAPTGDWVACGSCGGGSLPVHHCALEGTTLLRKPVVRSWAPIWDGAVCLVCELRKEKPTPSWISTSQLVADALLLADKIMEPISMVAGVPRSGMLPASVIATHLHVPLASLSEDGLQELESGARLRTRKGGSVLIVDDTVASGRAIRIAKKRVMDPITAAVYCPPEKRDLVDYCGSALPLPHYLEWNFANSIHAETCGWDLDGVIHGHADRLLMLPVRSPVRLIATARLESQREITEAWLNRHGIVWDALEMWPGTEEERTGTAVAQWKGATALRHKCSMYVESELGLSRLIHKYSKLRVICPPAGKVFG